MHQIMGLALASVSLVLLGLLITRRMHGVFIVGFDLMTYWYLSLPLVVLFGIGLYLAVRTHPK